MALKLIIKQHLINFTFIEINFELTKNQAI